MARRRANAFSYASASPYFIFRGFVWMAGCAAGDLMPLVLAGLWLRKV